jgi:hypothetical protein
MMTTLLVPDVIDTICGDGVARLLLSMTCREYRHRYSHWSWSIELMTNVISQCSVSTVLMFGFPSLDLRSLIQRRLDVFEKLSADSTHRLSIRECVAAASVGYLEALQLIMSRGVEWHIDVCREAALQGHLNILEWMWKFEVHRHQWGPAIISYAAANGHLNVVKWLRTTANCEWDYRTCYNAARGGHLEVLKWAHANGAIGLSNGTIGLDDYSLNLAVAGDHQHVIDWFNSIQ